MTLPRGIAKLGLATALSAGLFTGGAMAAPEQTQIEPVAVYKNTQSAFGLAFDSANDRIWYSQGDPGAGGDDLVHSLRPFNSFTAAERAALPKSGSISVIDLTTAEEDVFGTTDPEGAGGHSANFSALGFDSNSGRLVTADRFTPTTLEAFEPVTANNLDTTFGNTQPSPRFGLVDGLDVDGSNTWFSGDIGNIYKNEVLFADRSDAADTTLPTWSGLGDATAEGWAGAEQVGDRLFAVAVHDFADTGRSRTIVSFDVNTGELDTFDPDGDESAARWEDLAFDGRYLYAADLRGDFDGAGPAGDIYVFDVTSDGGSIIDPGEPVPVPATLILLVVGLAGLIGVRHKLT